MGRSTNSLADKNALSLYIYYDMKVKTLNVKCNTFRRTLQVIVGWGKQYFDKAFWEFWYDYELTTGFYFFDKENNCNIIWLADFDICTLVHELEHCVLSMCEQCWIEIEWEAPAYMYEELFAQIWMKRWKYFKLSKDVKKYFNYIV